MLYLKDAPLIVPQPTESNSRILFANNSIRLKKKSLRWVMLAGTGVVLAVGFTD